MGQARVDGAQAEAAREDPGYRERWVTAQDGLRLYVRDYGDPRAPGVPVLCLAGLVRNSKDSHTLALHLAKGRRVLCLDYRGRGRSDYDPVWQNYRPEVYAGDALQVLFASSVHKVVVIGTSMGGLLAMGLAVFAPTTVVGAVLNDIGPEVGNDGFDRILDYVGGDQPQPDWPSAVAHVKELFEQVVFDSEERWLAFAKGTYREGAGGQLNPDWDPSIARALAKSRANMPDLWPYFRGLGKRPTLAIRGLRSDILTQHTFERMAEVKPDLHRLGVEGVGHVPALDEPPVLPEIEKLLAQIDREQGHHQRDETTVP